MRIEYLQISNVLSFPYHADVNQAEKLEFYDGLNIIIGENGSGKSTALEVVNFLFRRVVYRQFSFNRDLFGRRATLPINDRRQVLQPTNQTSINGFRLDSNWDSEEEEQRIRIALRLDDIDRQNIANIRAYFADLADTLSSYSTHSVTPDGADRDTYVIDVVLDRAANSFSVHLQGEGPDFGFAYLTVTVTGVDDSLDDGKSYFQVEVERVRTVLEQSAKSPFSHSSPASSFGRSRPSFSRGSQKPETWTPPSIAAHAGRALAVHREPVGRRVEAVGQDPQQPRGGRTEESQPEPLDVRRSGVVADKIALLVVPRHDVQPGGNGVDVRGIRRTNRADRGGGRGGGRGATPDDADRSRERVLGGALGGEMGGHVTGSDIIGMDRFGVSKHVNILSFFTNVMLSHVI